MRTEKNKPVWVKVLTAIFIGECVLIAVLLCFFRIDNIKPVFQSVYMITDWDNRSAGPEKTDTDAVEGTQDMSVTERNPGKSLIKDSNADNETDKLNRLKKEFIDTIDEKYPGTDLSFMVKNLDTGAKVVHNNKKMNSASLIKLFILENVYAKVSAGEYNLTPERDKDLEIMITKSDNKAANNFIEDFGGENEKRKIEESNLINRYINQRHYTDTELNRKMYDTTPPGGPTGYQNYTSVEDVGAFLQGVYKKTLLDEPYNTYIFNLMKNQERTNKIPAKLTKKYPGIIVANKTGELSQVENDAAIIIGKDFNLIFAIMINDIPYKADGSTDYELKEDVQETISEFALKLVELYI